MILHYTKQRGKQGLKNLTAVLCCLARTQCSVSSMPPPPNPPLHLNISLHYLHCCSLLQQNLMCSMEPLKGGCDSRRPAVGDAIHYTGETSQLFTKAGVSFAETNRIWQRARESSIRSEWPKTAASSEARPSLLWHSKMAFKEKRERKASLSLQRVPRLMVKWHQSFCRCPRQSEDQAVASLKS